MGPTKEQFERERRFFIAYWELRKKFYSAENESDSFWDNLIWEVQKLGSMHPGKFQEDLLLALVSDIEARSRGSMK